jgi:hypothetical protein
LSTRKELFIALFGHDGTEYGRAAVGPLVPDGGDLVNAETIKFPPMTHERGTYACALTSFRPSVVSFAVCDADGRLIVPPMPFNQPLDQTVQTVPNSTKDSESEQVE